MTTKLKLPIEIVKLSGELQEDGYPFEAIILSGEPIDAWHGNFIVDLATMKYHKQRLTVNYNHDNQLIIGYGENFQVTPEGLKSTGKLVAGSFADELVNLARQGVPFEASVEIDLGNAVETRVGADAHVTANGRTYKGPISLYSDVPLRAYAICPLGADKHTSLKLLQKKELYMPKAKPMTKLSDDEKDKDEELSQETTSTVKSQELDDFCKMFGNDNGLALFQSGADIAEAKQWQALNEKYSKYLSTDEDEKDEPTPPESDPTPDTDDDEKKDKLSAALTKLTKTVEALTKANETQSAEIVKLKAAALSGGADPVSGGRESADEPKGKNSVERLAEKYRNDEKK